jgi:hypothetical protein
VCAINGARGTAPNLPFGGTGWSGNGACEIGGRVADGYTRWQAVLDDTEDTGDAQGPDDAGEYQYEASNWDRL